MSHIQNGGGGGGSTSLVVNSTPISGGAANQILYDNGGILEEASVGTGLSLSGNVLSSTGAPLNSPAFTGTPTAPTASAGDNSTQIATDAFVTTAVNNAIAGVNPAEAVQVATTAAGDTSGMTYSNGASGIGATLTGPNNTAITIDGVTFTSVGQRLLVKNDTQSPSGAFNGVYTLTALQTIGTGAIFTRATDYNQPSDINNTGAIPVTSGTANASTSWLLTSTVTTIGTSPLTYSQFTISPTNLVTLTGTQTLTNKDLSSVTNTFPVGSNSQKGIVEVDGTSITAAAGVLSVVGGTLAASYLSSNWYMPFPPFASGSQSASANTIYGFFGTVLEPVTIKALGFKSGSSAARNVQVAVYSVSGSTATLVDHTGDIAASVSGTSYSGAVLNGTDTLVPGVLYFFATNRNTGATEWCVATSTPGFATSAAGSSSLTTIMGNGITGKTIAQTYGTWPSLTLSGAGAMTDSTLSTMAAFQVN